VIQSIAKILSLFLVHLLKIIEISDTKDKKFYIECSITMEYCTLIITNIFGYNSSIFICPFHCPIDRGITFSWDCMYLLSYDLCYIIPDIQNIVTMFHLNIYICNIW